MSTRLHRIRYVGLLGALALALSACGGGPADLAEEVAERLPEPTDEAADQPAEPADDPADEPADDSAPPDDSFIPTVPPPDDVPVFPGAVMWGDMSVAEQGHWLYETSASGEEIVEFFIEAFADAGVEVDLDSSGAAGEQFFVFAEPHGVYFLDDSDMHGVPVEDITASTPGRGYGISIDLDAWAAR